MDSPTLTEESVPSIIVTSAAPQVLALVVAWSVDEPHRLGEVAIVPPTSPGSFLLLGRGHPREDDPYPRVLLTRQRPGKRESVPPLASQRISRVQLFLRAEGTSHIEVRNEGRCPLLCNGAETSQAVLFPGQTLQLGQQLLLLCVERPAWLSGDAQAESPEFAFGEADPDGIVGESPLTWQLRRRIAIVASRPDHVLVLGATGTGKELVARAIHHRGPRKQRTQVSRNAATFPETLIDAELFGNAKNFPNTGMPERPGLVGQADMSTLFLDEFAELPQTMQTHLLRVLDSGEYQRLGEAVTRRADFRLVAATNRPAGALKQDVLARFTFRIEIPPLNQRREDIPLLVAHLMRQIAQNDPKFAEQLQRNGDSPGAMRFSCAAMKRLVEHDYVSNVRELRMLLWQRLVKEAEGAADETLITPARTGPTSDAPPPLDAHEESQGLTPPPRGGQLTPERIQACLDRNNGVIERAWAELGLSSRYALARLINKHGLELRRSRRPRRS